MVYKKGVQERAIMGGGLYRALQAGGQGFESLQLHHFLGTEKTHKAIGGSVMVRQAHIYKRRVRVACAKCLGINQEMRWLKT